jgi:hypothetical protein
MMILVHKKILKFQKWVTNKEIPFLKKKVLGDLINSRGLEILMKTWHSGGMKTEMKKDYSIYFSMNHA